MMCSTLQQVLQRSGVQLVQAHSQHTSHPGVGLKYAPEAGINVVQHRYHIFC